MFALTRNGLAATERKRDALPSVAGESAQSRGGLAQIIEIMSQLSFDVTRMTLNVKRRPVFIG